MEKMNYDLLHRYLIDAEDKIKELRFKEAKELLIQCLVINDRSPQVHNLFGIMYEYQGNREMAMRHYRAANVFDGTYRPAIENMMRCSDNSFHNQKHPYFGSNELSFEERQQLSQDEKNRG